MTAPTRAMTDEEAIRLLIAVAPPLTQDQTDRLAMLLRPVTDMKRLALRSAQRRAA